MTRLTTFAGFFLICFSSGILHAEPYYADYSGAYQCSSRDTGSDVRAPLLELNGATGRMTVSPNGSTSFSGYATRAYLGALSRVEYYLNWRAQSAIIVTFSTQGIRASSARASLSLPDSMTGFTCSR